MFRVGSGFKWGGPGAPMQARREPAPSRYRSDREGGIIAERNFRMSDRTRVNERIRAREVRVIDEEGAQLGVMEPF